MNTGVPFGTGFRASHGAASVSAVPASIPHAEELEMAIVELWREARFIACAPRPLLTGNLAALIEARECLNDAIAKAGDA